MPAIDPWNPASDSLAIAATVSSMLVPVAAASGATYFNASPNCVKFVLAVVNAPISTLLTFVKSLAVNCIPRIVLAAMSAASATSISPAAASSIAGSIAIMISVVVSPAIAMTCIASADCSAVKMVVAPISFAFC